ncbi:two-component sensor histidine kinase [Altererythrobacter sp. CC-YST694]|nr:two-component sensor histidine kinase [Altererythrobacter sp. CC-YST694]
MLLAVAAALLVAQAFSAALLYRASEQRRQIGVANGLAFQLVSEPRFDYREAGPNRPPSSHSPSPTPPDSAETRHPLPQMAVPPEAGEERERPRRWQRLRVEHTAVSPLRSGEVRDTNRETLLREILAGQGIEPAELVVTNRAVSDDPYVQQRLQETEKWRGRPDWVDRGLIVAGLLRKGEKEWTVARMPHPAREPGALGGIIAQTMIIYVMLVGGLALLLRRITRPLAALTRRMEQFARTRETDGQLEPAGPEDTRRLIEAHNEMEGRIAALLDEKDVMLGAIGHDLKTPLAALRVRIESVEDPVERGRMAGTIEDITRTLDDILSLARVGRPSDQPENTDLAALTASVVEEFEDMGEDVEFGEGGRLPALIRATWLRRALRNLVANALRYGGGKARVSLRREGNMAVLRVDDDGPGIPDHELGAMLEPFRRGEASRSRETGGAGLGLTLARAIAEQHGGSLRIANRHHADGTVAGLTAEIRVPIG